MLFVITGPSGAGKTTLIKEVLEDLENVSFSISHTTRPKRDSEKEGREYYFISVEEFKEMVRGEKFAEWAVVHGHYYGTSKKEIDKKGERSSLLLDIDVQGAQQIKEKYPEAVFIFIMPPVFGELKQRLKSRGDESPEAVEKRIEVAGKEMNCYQQFDYIIVNDKLENAVAEIESVVCCWKCRIESRQKEAERIIRSFRRGRAR